MADKKISVEDAARAEVQEIEERKRAREEFEASIELVRKELPSRFFKFTDDVKNAVGRFNKEAPAERRLTWHESSALALRDTKNLNLDFNFNLGRKGAEAMCILATLERSGLPDTFVIEIQGLIRAQESFRVRVDSFGTKGVLNYRVHVNGTRVNTPFEELPERLVLTIVQNSIEHLLV